MDKVALPAKDWTLWNKRFPFPLANISKMDKILLEARSTLTTDFKG